MLQMQPPTASQLDQQPLSPASEMYENLEMLEAADAAEEEKKRKTEDRMQSRKKFCIRPTHRCKICFAEYSQKTNTSRHIKVQHVLREKMVLVNVDNEVEKLKPDGRKRSLCLD